MFSKALIQRNANIVYQDMKATALHSCLYKATVMHKRLSPKAHYFQYNIFLFYLNLEELDHLHRKLWWMSRNRFNIFNFRDKDHLQLPREKPDRSRNIREQLTTYLAENGVAIGTGRIMVLTNLCTLGYQFNPVSFYYCYDEYERPLCAVVEVGNTFGEMKPYFLGAGQLNNQRFELNTPKEFFVSPFMALDTRFHFKLSIPDEALHVHINDYDQDGNLLFLSSLKGQRKQLTDANLLYFFFSFPLITLKVIAMIHWQAFLLWTRRLRFIRKADNPFMQKQVFRPYKP